MVKRIQIIGNSKGIILPKSVIKEIGLEENVKIEVKNGKIILRKPRKNEKI